MKPIIEENIQKCLSTNGNIRYEKDRYIYKSINHF